MGEGAGEVCEGDAVGGGAEVDRDGGRRGVEDALVEIECSRKSVSGERDRRRRTNVESIQKTGVKIRLSPCCNEPSSVKERFELSTRHRIVLEKERISLYHGKGKERRRTQIDVR